MYCSVDEITFYSFKNSSNVIPVKISMDGAITAGLLELILSFKEEPKMVLRAFLRGQHWTGFGKIPIAVHRG